MWGPCSKCVAALQFKRSFKRNDKPICSAVSQFLAHLINQQIADDMLAFEVAILLLDNPSGGAFLHDLIANLHVMNPELEHLHVELMVFLLLASSQATYGGQIPTNHIILLCNRNTTAL